MNFIRLRLLAALMFLLSVRAIAGMPGDELLALTKLDANSVTSARVSTALSELFRHLEVPKETQARFAFTKKVRVIFAEQDYEASELSGAILVARRGVTIGSAENVAIVAGGDVEIAHASNVFGATGARIKLSHDGNRPRGAPSFIVSYKEAEVSFAMGTSIYAVQGARFSHGSNVVAYNTDILSASHGQAKKFIRAPIFLNEVRREPVENATVVATGKSLNFSGDRCVRGWDIDKLAESVPGMARREADCFKIEKIEVTCELQPAAPSFRSVEVWNVRLCGKNVAIVAAIDGMWPESASREGFVGHSTASIGLKSPLQPAVEKGTLPFQPIDTDQEKQMAALYQRALKLPYSDYRGRIDVYTHALSIYQHHVPSYLNRATARSGISDYVGALADFDKAIEIEEAIRSSGGVPPSRHSFSGRAQVRLDLGDLQGARADLERALNGAQGDPGLLLNRAFANLRTGELKGAIEDCSFVVTKYPYVDCFETIAWAHLILGNNEAAYENAFQALAKASELQQAASMEGRGRYFVLAGYLARRGMGRREDAKAWLAEWGTSLSDSVWPGPVLSYFKGNITREQVESSIRNEKERFEAQAFMAFESELRGELRDAEARYLWIAEKAKGYSLARVIAERRMKGVVPIR